MLKKMFLILFLFGLGITLVSGQNPIPSYNVPVYHFANFQEQLKSCNTSDNSRGKSGIIIRANGATSSIAIVYVYSLDMQDVLGPFTMYGGETLTVSIDSREWGVLVESDDHITVDVWIE
jgi:hypothetical protein